MSEDLDKIAEHLRIAGLLIKNHKNETLTSQEELDLHEWLSKSHSNQLLFKELQDRKQIAEELEKLDPVAKQAALEDIRKVLFPASEEYVAPVLRSKNIPVRSMVWRFSAAAILIGTIAAVYLLYVRKTGNPMPAMVTQPAPLADVAPGRSRAILTLSDGKTISLDSTADGLVSEQSGAKIMKLDNNQLTYNRANDKAGEIAFNTLSTPKAGQYELTLPDGTRVWLNNASSLRYPTTMNGTERVVELQGEAYFEVAKNKSMPFTVKSGDMRVEVLGTSFNLMTYGDEETRKTTLLTGSVRVVEGGNQVLLHPGEQSTIDLTGNQKIVQGVDVEEVVAWKNGYFHFAGTDLQGVMRQLARWYDVDVQYTGQIPAQVFSGEIQRSLPLSLVLKGLENSQIHFTIADRKIIITKP